MCKIDELTKFIREFAKQDFNCINKSRMRFRDGEILGTFLPDLTGNPKEWSCVTVLEGPYFTEYRHHWSWDTSPWIR